jgi:hypothetical protein
MRARALLAALAVALGLVAYAGALDPTKQLAGRDLFHLFYPLGKVVANAARAGWVVPPARDPTRGLGVALSADPLAWSFYPPRLLHAVLPYDLAFKLVLLLHGSLAGVGAARLARAIGATRRSSALAIAGAVLAGPVIALHRHPNLLAAAAWAPLVVAFTLDLAAHPERARRSLAFASGGVALMLLAGGAELVLGLAPVLAVVAALSPLGTGSRLRTVLSTGAALGVGGLLAAIQLAPTWVWLPSTLRPGAVSGSEAVVWSLPLRRVLSLALPSDRGEPGGLGHQPFSDSVYLGAVVFGLALLGAVRGDRRARALAAGVVLSLVLALGAHGVLFEFLRHLPIFDRFRYPEKLVLLAAVFLPALAARGLDEVLRLKKRGFGLGLLLVALATADLAWANARPGRGLLPTVPTAWLHDPPETVALLGTGRFIAGAGAVDAPPGLPGEDATAVFLRTKKHHRDVLLGGLGGLYGLEDASCYGPFAPRQLADLLFATRLDDYFLRITGTSGVIVPRREGERSLPLPHSGPGPNPELPLEAVPGTSVSVAQAPGGPRASLVSAELLAATEPRGRFTCPEARVLERDARHVLVEADASEPCLVVLSELYLEGVTATVDGEPAEVRFVDSALVAVPIAAGRHRVNVEWHTPGLGIGALASLAGLAIVAYLLFVRRAG